MQHLFSKNEFRILALMIIMIGFITTFSCKDDSSPTGSENEHKFDGKWHATKFSKMGPYTMPLSLSFTVEESKITGSIFSFNWDSYQTVSPSALGIQPKIEIKNNSFKFTNSGYEFSGTFESESKATGSIKYSYWNSKGSTPIRAYWEAKKN